ncbi:CEAM6-like protein, partial [Mya arenaria]
SAHTKPVITPSGVVPVVQGSNLTLTCFYESNVTTFNYQWCSKNRAPAYSCLRAIGQDECVNVYADGSLYGIQCLGNNVLNLTIYNVQNADDGVYWKCNHEVGKSSTISEPIQFDVQDGINNVILSPSTTLYRVIEGNQLEAIICSARCNPACSYTWSTSGKTVSATGTLDLGQAERREAGTYMCKVQNTISRFSKNGPVVSLDVI